MQFIDLEVQQARLRPSLMRRIEAVLAHGHYIMGTEVTELESKLSQMVGGQHCVSCSNGTDALLMALMALGVGAGDVILTTPFTFIATAEVVTLLGATPVFVDIELDSFNLNPALLEAEILKHKGRVKGIIPVDLFGLSANYEALRPIADRHGLFLLQDAAQSMGARYRGRPIGAQAEVTATSFFPSKPLGCYGDGGAIFTPSAEIAERLRSIRIHGKGSDKYDNVRLGLNGRLDTLQAAVLLAKLEVFEEEIQLRQQVAQRYSQLLPDWVVKPQVPQGDLSAWAQYTLLSPERDQIRDHLAAQKIPTMIYYPTPLHRQTAYANLGYGPGSLPVSERAALQVLSLPMHPYLSHADQDRVIEAVSSCRAKA